MYFREDEKSEMRLLLITNTLVVLRKSDSLLVRTEAS
jgi:hypothetical protein